MEVVVNDGELAHLAGGLDLPRDARRRIVFRGFVVRHDERGDELARRLDFEDGAVELVLPFPRVDDRRAGLPVRLYLRSKEIARRLVRLRDRIPKPFGRRADPDLINVFWF